MEIKFAKYEGAGNDFIIIDNRNATFVPEVTLVKRLCDRHFGIGADGLMLLENDPDHDFKMYYANADGRPGSMCGNGGRCIVSFAATLGVIAGDCHFIASDGPHSARISGSGVVLGMKDVSAVHAAGENGQDFVLDTGSPHYVRFTGDLSLDVYKTGQAVRYSEAYRDAGINVNFVQVGSGGLELRTYERGVEGETLACGTGVTAAALAYMTRENLRGDQIISVQALGGNLRAGARCHEDGSFSQVWLEGPATFVFNGSISL